MNNQPFHPLIISYDDAIGHLDWVGAVDALIAGHHLPKAQLADVFLGPPTGTLLSRSAYIEGLGYGTKSVTVVDGNPARGRPTVQGAMLLFSEQTGEIEAVVDSRLVTEIKTAADSTLGARLLARPDSRRLLIIGAGIVAVSLVKAYSAAFPDLENISVWARRPERALAIADRFKDFPVPVSAKFGLAEAVASADIISTATMAREPVLPGDWVRPGTHVDLIGAFKADMREADDHLIGKAALYVDSRETTISHIGELKIPIASGIISEQSVLGDLYDMVRPGFVARPAGNEITIFKNGGGAHLDLMVAAWIAGRVLPKTSGG